MLATKLTFAVGAIMHKVLDAGAADADEEHEGPGRDDIAISGMNL